MRITPITLKQASEFVKQHHRHNTAQRGHKFSIGLVDEKGELIGVGTAGRPVSRALDNGKTIEITRICVKEGYRNGCSMLYGRLKRILQLMGYEKIITYTLKSESGSSLKAIGAKIVGEVYPRSWNTQKRKRREQGIYFQEKFRWEL